jgi:hypothetical protein
MSLNDEFLLKAEAIWESLPMQELQVPNEYISSSLFKTPSGIISEFDFNKMEWVYKSKFPKGFKFLEYVSQYLYPDCNVRLKNVSNSETHLTVYKSMRLAEERPLVGFIIQYNDKKTME